MKIIIYNSNIIKIGGVETFTYNMIKQLSKYYDTLVLYKSCDAEQLSRLRMYSRCEEYDPRKEYKCDICITATSWGGYPDAVISTKNEYWQIIHANYKEMAKNNYVYSKWDKTTKHYAVSNTVRDIFNEMYNEKAETMYNILDDIQPTQRILKLVSATRLSGEKGYNRMVRLTEELKKRDIKFRWLIFTDLTQYKIPLMQDDEIVYMKPTYDIWDYIKEADYGVQLSDTEGYSYFINECLQYGTAMLTTNFDSTFESLDKTNGYILDFELFDKGKLDTKEEWDKVIDKIVNKIPKDFNYKPKTTIDDWIKIIGKPEKKEKYDYKKEFYYMRYEVVANNKWQENNMFCTDTKTIPKEDDTWLVNKARLDVLLGDNQYKIKFIKDYRDIEEDKQEEESKPKVEEVKEPKKTTTKKTTTKKKGK